MPVGKAKRASDSASEVNSTRRERLWSEGGPPGGIRRCRNGLTLMDSPTAEAAISAVVAFSAAQLESNGRRLHRHGTDQIAHFIVLDQDEEDRTCALYRGLRLFAATAPLCGILAPRRRVR